MKKRIVLSLLAAITAGSLLLSGCEGVDLTDVNTEDTTLSAEMEQENLSDGNVTLHSVWYNTDDTALMPATITFSDGKDELFSGSTDVDGNLEVCTLTGNTTLTCKVTDSSGTTIATAEIVFKISDDYESLTVYPVHEDGDSEHILELPSSKTDVRSAIYITEDGGITIANLSPYYESSDGTTDETTDETTTDDTTTDGTTTDGTTTDGTTTDGTTTDGTTTDGTATDGATTDGTTTDATTTDGTAATGTDTTTTDGTTTDGTTTTGTEGQTAQ